MRRFRRSPVAFISSLMLLGLLAVPTSAEPSAPQSAAPATNAALAAGQIRLHKVVGGLSGPIGVVNAGDGTGRLFVIEQRGTVRVVANNKLQAGLFLDVRGVSAGFTVGSERGLLGLAFHPAFETNRKLFAYFTDGGGDLRIAQFTANAAGTSASVSTFDSLMTIEHSSAGNHNGGQLLFGPDGMLYAFVGDGGDAGDPGDDSQRKDSLLGKTLRIAPNLTGSYTIPAGNPYAGATAGLDEIWSIGLRNPWRASFDRSTGFLWIGDVGQGSWEEIDREPANTPGRNYGWDCREGLHSYNDPSPVTSCSGLSFTDPVAEYGHGAGDCSVTGGYVYRGTVFLDFVGQYILGDYCSGRISTLAAGAGSPTFQFHRDTSALITSFGESESGEIYMTDQAGTLYRIVAPPFSDVTDSAFIDDIMWLYNNAITLGCGGGKFCPKAAVTRDQMATFLDRAIGLPATSTDFFTDDEGNQHEAAINRVAAAGISIGCATNRYCPSSVVTRAQMATFLDRALGLPATSTDFFTDDEGSIHEGAINRLAAAGITNGCSATTYCPNASTIREQMAAFLRRAFD